ncbi:MAG TPA: hypothetical protein PKN33_03060 [Phycisphaerae bacterium]|nr:hypothetical protein [Phycisphaerae bacterium]
MSHNLNEFTEINAVRTARWMSSKRAIGLGIVIVLLVALAFAILSDRPTARYWNAVHDLALQADSVRNLDTPQDAKALLDDIDGRLAELDPAGVDPRAVDAANRFRAAVASASIAIDAGQNMLDHPIRTAVKSATAMVAGKSPIRDLHDRLEHLREVTLEAYENSRHVHGDLTWRYPLSSFAKPIPPDVHSLDELLHELDRMDAEDGTLRDRAFSIGRLLGALAGALLAA